MNANAEIKGLGDGITDWLWLEHHEEVLRVECRHVERAFDRQISNVRLYSCFAVEVLDAAQLSIGHLGHIWKCRPDRGLDTTGDCCVRYGFSLGNFDDCRIFLLD